MTASAQATQATHAAARPDSSSRELAELAECLDGIRAEMVEAAGQARSRLDAIQPQHRASAANLLNYLALRSHDLRPLQAQLATLGLSSLGRSEGQVLSSVDAVCRALSALRTGSACQASATAATVARGADALTVNAQALLGPAPADRQVRIMVTMPSEAAHDYALIHELVRSGMDCMRINCAHDSSALWAQMIEHLRRANRVLGRSCKVAMDLAGPKLRTGPLEPGPAVIKIQPERDAYGRVIAPARIWLTSTSHGEAAPSPAAASLPLPHAWLHRLKNDETLKLTDARGAHRVLRVVDVNPDGAWVEANKTCYVVPGTKLKRLSRKGESTAAIGNIEPREEPLVLHSGDTLIITRDLKPGRPATRDAAGRVLTPASIACTLPEVFEGVRSGERIWLNDGTIGGVVQDVQPDRVVVKIDMARAGGAKLRSDKGINLPDSDLRLSALTAKDIEDLEFVVRHADLVSLSFVNRASDLELLQKHLQRLHGEKLGIILKIETRRGFENLPDLLLTSMRSACCGVMIARGDLAVECGFERLAELQEEILWICEAAHVPVIWATQVLESLAKDGVPSRAEITDAAMSERAECVMLNKGPHICEAVHVLDDILRRMQAHVSKKRSMLRELKLAQRFLQPGSEGH